MLITPDERHLLLLLAKRKRTGWIDRGVPLDAAESVAEHTIKVMLAVRAYGRGYDVERATRIALAHDVGECLEEDYRPGQIEPDEKRRREEIAVYRVTEPLETRDAIRAAWHEYEERRTPEARAVKNFDVLDPCIQAIVYARAGHRRMDEFFERAPGRLIDPSFLEIHARIPSIADAKDPFAAYLGILRTLGRE